MGQSSTISAGVPVELATALQAFVELSGRSADDVIIAALGGYLDEAALTASLDEAERDIDEGRYLTQEQMGRWFAEHIAAARQRADAATRQA